MISDIELIEFMTDKAYKPLTYQELEKHFEIHTAEEFKAFLKLLTQLEQDGKIVRTRSDCYGVPERMNLFRGKLQTHAKGFGFLLPEDRELTDIYVHANDMMGAMNGDTVLVRITAKGVSGGRLEGEVVRIIKRAITQVVGMFQGYESYAFVKPDDKRIYREIFIPQEAFLGAQDGDKVVVKLVAYPEGRAAAQGEIVEVLGHKDEPGMDIISIIRKHQLPEKFPDEVMAEAELAPEAILESELTGRKDLRSKRIVTIDGEDAKDLDDAISIERLPSGNIVLGVHIADVGYYVKENSALDREAYERGCSVYLVDRVIPMLPPRLSNGICSLNPQVDRLTLSCEMEFDANAQVVKHNIFTSVIRTAERMTYTNVRKILLNEDEEVTQAYHHLVDDFRLMEELALMLRGRRMRRGAIDFDFHETKVIVDELGKPVDIVRRERSIAEMLIEEFMLAANETVAEHFHWLKVPFLYRIHEDPNAEKLMNFMEFVTNFGYVVRGKGNTVHPRALQALLEEIKGTKEETVISTVLLRSMKQAKYDSESLGHFGLAAEYYSHFTSPIRRYPDLVIHRIIREVIEQGTLSEQRNEYLGGRMDDIAQQSSERERVAIEAERETDALKKAEFMLDKIGEEFDGIISSVTSFGLFVELENSVEGLIHISYLHDDYYHYHERQHALIGERTSNIYRIGDEVRVRVMRVNMDEHTIDFEMITTGENKPRKVLAKRGDRGRLDAKPRKGGGKGGPGPGKGKGSSVSKGNSQGNSSTRSSEAKGKVKRKGKGTANESRHNPAGTKPGSDPARKVDDKLGTTAKPAAPAGTKKKKARRKSKAKSSI